MNPLRHQPKKNRLKHPKADPAKRKRFLRLQARYRRKGKELVYLDESGFRRDWVRAYGYSVKGRPCIIGHDWHGKNQVNAIGAWHQDKRLFAVGLFEQGINGTVFQTWLEQVLLPQLPHHSVVIMDNASFHKRVAVAGLLESKGHTVLWLPPYSPDLNPIEKVWAWVKALRNKQRLNDIGELFSLCMND
nr:IS630 family transposase [Conchiformibius kuhniae]